MNTMIAAIREALESVSRSIAFDVQDWAADRRMAWIYGILMGWDEATEEVAAKHRWTAQDIATMERHRKALAHLEALEADLKGDVVGWQYRWLDPSGDAKHPRETEWKPIDGIAAGQTLENKAEELRGYRGLAGTPLYDVRAIYAHPPKAEPPVDIAAVIEAGNALDTQLANLIAFAIAHIKGNKMDELLANYTDSASRKQWTSTTKQLRN